jgi:hypothetical protein
MCDNTLENAFIRGMQKRAEDLGLEKEAFMPFFMQNIAPMFGGAIAQHYAAQGIKNLAKAKLRKGVKPGLLTRMARGMHNTLESKGIKGPLAQTGLMIGSTMAVDPIFGAINKRLYPEMQEQGDMQQA